MQGKGRDRGMIENMWGAIVAVTNRRLSVKPYARQIERICSKGPQAVLIREKDLSGEEYARLAGKAGEICRKYHIPCVYHTYLEEARQSGTKNIHLPLPMLREYAENFALSEFESVGVSVHSVEEAKEAVRLGASVLTAGHVYATDCKKGLAPRGLSFLREVCQSVELPVYAIGGIHTDEQVREVMECGAAGACIMSEAMRL